MLSHITKDVMIKLAVGTALVVPCCIAGKFVGAALGLMAGGIAAYGFAEVGVTYVMTQLKTHEGEPVIESAPE